MDFRTKQLPIPLIGLISHSAGVFMLGSCFTDHIGNRLDRCMIEVCHNPFGALFNPASIANILQRIVSDTLFCEDDFMCHKGMWHCLDTHSLLSSHIKEKAIDRHNSALSLANSALKRASVVILTFGTAQVYAYKRDGHIVGNCHKLPSAQFEKRLLSVDQCSDYILKCVRLISCLNPECKVILTVSPVRHLADSLHGNNLSKSTLLLATEKAIKSQNDNKGVVYFPAYEAVVDDLRDYRFYDTDMCHPTPMAADYVFDLFCQSTMSSKTLALNKQILQTLLMTQHKVMSDDPEAKKMLIRSYVSKVEKITAQLPYLASRFPEIK